MAADTLDTPPHDRAVAAPAFNAAVSLMYEAALEPRLWPEALAAAARCAGADAGFLNDVDYGRSVLWQMVAHNVSDELNRIYLERHVADDPRLPVMLRSLPLTLQSDFDAVPATVRRSHPLYTEFLRPNGAAECLMVKLAVEDTRSTALLLFRVGTGEERFSASQRQAVELLVPHLDRACRIARRFMAYDQARGIGDQWLQALDVPVAVLSGERTVLARNHRFDALLREGRPLVLQGNRCACAEAAPERGLQRAFEQARMAAEGRLLDGAHALGPIIFPVEREGAHRWLFTLAPLGQRQGLCWPGSPKVMLKVADLRSPPEAAVLRQGFGLTSAEARLAREIVDSAQLSEAADRIGVSLNTAKTQLRSVFAKTRTRRQADLVALLQSLPR